MSPENIYPIDDLLLNRKDKESILKQKGSAFWFCGLSGSGKSTLAVQLERDLHHVGLHSIVLDGDNLRNGLNQDLGFSDRDREENLRRVSELTRILVNNGLITIISFISPKQKFREDAKSIIGEDVFHEIYIKASFEKCALRDVKGLYAREKNDEINNFTGKGASFEAPLNPWLTIETDFESQNVSSKKLFEPIFKKVKI